MSAQEKQGFHILLDHIFNKTRLSVSDGLAIAPFCSQDSELYIRPMSDVVEEDYGNFWDFRENIDEYCAEVGMDSRSAFRNFSRWFNSKMSCIIIDEGEIGGTPAWFDIKRLQGIHQRNGFNILKGDQYSLIEKDGQVVRKPSKGFLSQLEVNIRKYHQKCRTPFSVYATNKVFTVRGESRYKKEIQKAADRIFKAGTQKRGDTLKDVVQKLTDNIEYVMMSEVPNGKCGSYHPVTLGLNITYGNDTQKFARLFLAAHEYNHAYNASYGQHCAYTGVALFQFNEYANKERAECKITITPDDEQKIEAMYNEINNKSLAALNEGLNVLITNRTVAGEKSVVHDMQQMKMPKLGRLSSYISEFPAAEFLENAIGRKELQDMYQAGPIVFQEEYDKIFGEGKFVEMVHKFPLQKHIEPTLQFLDYMLEQTPKALGGKTYAQIVAGLYPHFENSMDINAIRLVTRAIASEMPPAGGNLQDLITAKKSINDITKNMQKRCASPADNIDKSL